MSLGCGDWRAYLQCRGGGVLTELPFSSLSMGRRLDEVSDASVTVTGKAMALWPAAERDRCSEYLGLINPWEHELALWRDNEEAWVGPVLTPEWGVDEIVVPARDLAQWFERRLLERDRAFTATDLATIFHRYYVDALTRDPTPNIDMTYSATGILGGRSVVAGSYRRAADEMRELARSGLDFTMVGRSMLVGGLEVPTPAIGPFLVEHFAAPGPRRVLDGVDAGSETVVVGKSSSVTGAPLVGVAGGIDPAMGLLQDVTSETSIEDQTSIDAAAETRHDLLATAPEFVTGALIAEAPVDFAELVPGARSDLRLALFALDVVGIYRLQDVAVSVSVSGDTVTESVGVRFVTLGTVEEAA